LKKLFDIVFSFSLLILLLPIFIFLSILIFFEDFGTPLYIANRVGLHGKEFMMFKFRSMKSIEKLKHIVSTSENDPRITKVGKIIRKYKFDELSQILNVLIGNMSIVGPRPNIKVEVDLYSQTELDILSVKPGITDLASIVFFDLNKILSTSVDPNTDYNQLVRPWKSELALFYVKNQSLLLDLEIIFLTFLSVFSRKWALYRVRIILKNLKASDSLIDVCRLKKNLVPKAPPGMNEIISANVRNKL
jgi:lipopolysaccharide/colanic/teichoic acid biosynthesis glycosyltransferase